MKKTLKFLDLFAGAGGLSEGFIRAGYTPIAHVEMDTAACFTLKTRVAYYWLIENNKEDIYTNYLRGKITRTELYASVPKEELASVINEAIGKDTIKGIFTKVDTLLGGQQLDLVIGGPPCQAYSLVGRSRDKNGMVGDERNYLYKYYVKFLRRYKPKYFVFENVLGLKTAKDSDGDRYFDKMLDLFKKAGYETEYKVLNADDFGVLQNRRRIILVGRRGKVTDFYPDIAEWTNKYFVEEIFKDLPSLKAGKGKITPCKVKLYSGNYLYESKIKNDKFPVTWHVARPHNKQDLEIYRIAVKKWNKKHQRLNYNDLPARLKTHKNCKSFTDRFKVVASDLYFSQTVVAHISKDGHYYIHPDLKQNRSLTPREVARLQSFPDDFFFEGYTERTSRTAAFKQIGNAVPVLLAEQIANKLLETW